MNELRWILIGFGVVLLAAIYLWGRRGQRTVASEDSVVRVRPEPTVRGAESGALLDEPDAYVDEAPEDLVVPEPPLYVEPETAPTQAGAASPRSEEPIARTPRARSEPTLGDAAPTEELLVSPEQSAEAPTLSSSESPGARRIERRKILSVRLAANPQRIEGAKLLEALQSEALEHGKYDIFHRLHPAGASLFSVASMVEPGSFDVSQMPQQRFPGVTLFAQLPGPAPGMHALNEMIACARKLQQALGGTLQDERGVPLTVHRIERMRQEVREFERPATTTRSNSFHP